MYIHEYVQSFFFFQNDIGSLECKMQLLHKVTVSCFSVSSSPVPTDVPSSGKWLSQALGTGYGWLSSGLGGSPWASLSAVSAEMAKRFSARG